MKEPSLSVVEQVVRKAEVLEYLQRHEIVSVHRIRCALGLKKSMQATKEVSTLLKRHGFERWTGGSFVRKGAD